MVRKKNNFFCDVDPKCKTQNDDRMPYNNIQFLKRISDFFASKDQFGV